ncbi:histidine kinase [Spirochaetia bacterium]|nr:histidine kinase [Spirochaetia bacterium]
MARQNLFISSSITKTIKTSHVVIIGLMLIPLLLSVVFSLYNTISYDRLITNVNKSNRLIQIVKSDITNELWDIVAGNKSFAEGRQYEIIRDINYQLEGIMNTTGVATGATEARENRQLLEVAGRAMNTLRRYTDRLGSQMADSYPVIENERILDEIRGVSVLVSEILQDFIVLEIESAAQANETIKQRAFSIGVLEIVIIIFVTAFSIFVQISVASNVDASIGALVSFSSRIAEGDLSARATIPHVKELNALTEDLNTMAGKIKTLIEVNIQEQQNLQKSEMKALQAQITPHFLYNTLDSIIWLAEGAHYAEVISITRALSTFFRVTLNRGGEWVSVKDEFSHIESYCTIQKIRYRDILDYSIDCEAAMERNTILKLLLQPLVENALYHGIKNKRGRGTIKVRGWQEGAVQDVSSCLCFSVEDNGIGMTAERLADVREQLQSQPKPVTAAGAANRTSPPATANSVYGLYNVSKRLELYYNKAARLDIKSVYKEGTTVIIRVPRTV